MLAEPLWLTQMDAIAAFEHRFAPFLGALHLHPITTNGSRGRGGRREGLQRELAAPLKAEMLEDEVALVVERSRHCPLADNKR